MNIGPFGSAAKLASNFLPGGTGTKRKLSALTDGEVYDGWGDYGPVTHNQIIGSHPMHHSDQQQIAVNVADDLSGDVYFTKTEFLQNVSVTNSTGGTIVSTFTNQSIQINPGLSQMGPFVSQIAKCFSLYEYEGCIFQYKPTSGEFGANASNQLGKVIMATQYDPDQAAFVSAVEMENYDYSTSCKPSCGMHHGVETHPSQRGTKMLYVRTDNDLIVKDKVLTDLGTFQIATEGITVPANSVSIIGELWVTYKVRFSRAKIALPGNLFYSARLTGNGTTITAVNVLSNSTISGMGIGPASSSSTNLVVTFPTTIRTGKFLIVHYIAGAAANSILFSASSGLANATQFLPLVSQSGSGTLGMPATATGATSTNAGQATWLSINAGGVVPAAATIQLNWTANYNGTAYVHIYQLPNTVNDSLT